MSALLETCQASWDQTLAEKVRVHALDVTPSIIRAWLAEACATEEDDAFKALFKQNFLQKSIAIVDAETELRETCKKLMSVARKAGIKVPAPQQYARVNQGFAEEVAADLRERLAAYKLDENASEKSMKRTRKAIELERERAENAANAGLIVEGKRRRTCV